MILDAGNTQVHYEQIGENGKNVLLLHGWGCTIGHFEPIARELAKTHRVTLIDFPGHGQSGRPPEPWGVGEYAACVKEVMEKLGLAPCDLIAHSFGGRIALVIAAEWPHMVNRLVLTGCAGLKKPQTAEQKKRNESYQRKKKWLQALEKGPLFRKAAEKALEKLRKKYGSADYNALDEEMRKTFVRVIAEDLRPLLPRIQAPTLLIWGENDRDTPLWMGKTMEQEIPDAGLVVFDQDDHFAYLRQWPRFVRIVETFLT